MYGGGGGAAGLGYGKNNSDSDTITNNNSNLTASNMRITTSNDTNIQGGTLRANDTLALSVGNNLSVESLRDEYTSNSSGFNVSGGAKANRSPSIDSKGVSSLNGGLHSFPMSSLGMHTEA